MLIQFGRYIIIRMDMGIKSPSSYWPFYFLFYKRDGILKQDISIFDQIFLLSDDQNHLQYCLKFGKKKNLNACEGRSFCMTMNTRTRHSFRNADEPISVVLTKYTYGHQNLYKRIVSECWQFIKMCLAIYMSQDVSALNEMILKPRIINLN